MMNPYELWWANVAFEDDPGQTKRRPVLVVGQECFLVFALKVTSHTPRTNVWGECEIRRWQAAGLSKPSTIRASKFLRLSPEDFGEKIGDLHPADIAELEKILPQ